MANGVVPLGGTDGDKQVWIGLKGQSLDSQATWIGTTLTRDTVPPAVTITAPTATTTSQPYIQLQGYSPEQLLSLEYDLTNANVNETGVPGYVSEQHFDSALFKITTNWFECADIELAPGANTVTLRVTDLAGNTTTTILNYTFSLAGDTIPPALTVHWPVDSTEIGGSSFTFRGQMDDPTATISASIVGTSGVPTVVAGLVERNGLVWIENLPLEPGGNTLTLTMTDAAGNPSTTILTLTGSTVNLTINDLSNSGDLYAPITVTGTTNVSGHKIWVNGTEAIQPGDGIREGVSPCF